MFDARSDWGQADAMQTEEFRGELDKFVGGGTGGSEELGGRAGAEGDGQAVRRR